MTVENSWIGGQTSASHMFQELKEDPSGLLIDIYSLLYLVFDLTPLCVGRPVYEMGCNTTEENQ